MPAVKVALACAGGGLLLLVVIKCVTLYVRRTQQLVREKERLLYEQRMLSHELNRLHGTRPQGRSTSERSHPLLSEPGDSPNQCSARPSLTDKPGTNGGADGSLRVSPLQWPPHAAVGSSTATQVHGSLAARQPASPPDGLASTITVERKQAAKLLWSTDSESSSRVPSPPIDAPSHQRGNGISASEGLGCSQTTIGISLEVLKQRSSALPLRRGVPSSSAQSEGGVEVAAILADAS